MVFFRSLRNFLFKNEVNNCLLIPPYYTSTPSNTIINAKQKMISISFHLSAKIDFIQHNHCRYIMFCRQSVLFMPQMKVSNNFINTIFECLTFFHCLNISDFFFVLTNGGENCDNQYESIIRLDDCGNMSEKI